MKRCLIVGAGGWGRDTLSWALHVPQSDWQVAGFLDSDAGALNGKNFPYSILGDPVHWEPSADEVFIAGIGDPASRLRICGALIARGAEFLTLIHPTVVRALASEIGEGTVVAPHASIGANAKIGKFVLVNMSASVGHDSVTGDGTTLSCHVDVMGYVSIGRECYLGGHACVLPGRTVGDRAVIGAGGVVVKDVAPGAIVMGVPAEPRP